MTRSPGSDVRYAYAVGRIRSLETTLMGSNDLERMLDEETLSGSVRVMSDFGEYDLYASEIKDRGAAEAMISGELSRTYAIIDKLTIDRGAAMPFTKKRPASDPEIWRDCAYAWRGSIFLDGYIKMAIDLENIKIFFRARIAGRDRRSLEKALIPGGHLDKRTLAEYFDKPADEIASRAGHLRYGSSIFEGIEEYLRSGSLERLEKECDDRLVEYLKEAKMFSFGVEPVIAFALAKEVEAKNLRVILFGKLAGMGADEIRPLLRKSYV